MKRINENSKVTLTFKQLKRLVKESRVNEGPGAGYTVEMKDITLLNATATVADGAWKVKGDCRFIGHAEGYDWSTEELEYEGQFEFHVNTHQINKYVEKYLPEWDPENVTEEDIKVMLERTSAYSIEDISQMIGAGWLHVKWDGVLEVEHAGFDLDDRYLGADDADAGNFDIQLYDKGSAPEGDCNNCYFSIEAHDDFALDVETAYDMKDEEGEPLDEETERSTNKWGVFLGGELKQAFDDFDEAAAWADDTWPDDDRVEIRELDDDEMYEIDQDQDMTCCKCGEPVKRMFAHTLGNDVYCDDCFRDAARHHRLSYEEVSVKESSPYDDEFEEALSHFRTDYDIAEWMMDNVDFNEFGCSKSLLFADGRSGRNYEYWVKNLEEFLADHGIVGTDFEHIIDQLEYFWSVDNVEGYDDMENLVPPRNITLKK